jgi:pantetheine-phosphate adenylyltransferase
MEKAERIAIYPGSFDPITFGHLDILKRALKVFDHVTIAILDNHEKKPLFSVEERKGLIASSTKGLGVAIESFDGLLADYARKKKINTIVRSLRSVSDFDYEFQMAVANSNLNPDMESVFFMTGKEYLFLSSSVAKEVARHGGDISNMVPGEVAKRLREKYSK